jgi:cobalamin biosynthesis protein CobT
MMNAIEDPRDNNFVGENYPKFREQMDLEYNLDLDFENKYKDRAQEKVGYQPRFMQAGFEYIKLWFREAKGEKEEINRELPKEVQEVVEKTIDSAKDSWWRYPSRKEADGSEEAIRKYAQVSYEINRDEIWPEFKKLVEEDMQDQKMQELMKDMQQGQGEGQGQPMPQELKGNLTPEEQKELEDAIDKALEEAKKPARNASHSDAGGEKEKQESGKEKAGEKEGEQQEGKDVEGESQEGEEKEDESKGKPIDLDSLSEGLKQKIKDYMDLLPTDKKKELQDRAEKEIKELEKEINEELGGKLSDNPEKSASAEASADKKAEDDEIKKEREQESELDKEREKQRQKDLQKYKDILEKSLEKDANVYEEYRKEVLPIIEKLENDLREIFVARRASRWKSGFRTGKRIDIKTRIQEKAKGVSAVESKAWQKRELPTEKDYAISILVDLSGSMSRGGKIQETFKALIVLAEVLNRLSIKTEILGFNDRLYEYQTFGEDLSREIRENMGGVLREVNNSEGGRARYNDDGWALQETSKRLAKQRATEKFLMVLSDGIPEESPTHSGAEFDLGRMVNKIMQETDQKLIGLGIGGGTKHVEKFYPNSLADIDVKEMAEKLAGIIREMIVNYQNF